MKKTIKVDYLARVEGEGALHIQLDKQNQIENVELQIFEPPRFFEALLKGRKYSEAPDITARICGICPVAYQMSAVHAMENAFGVQVDGPLRQLRRLLYCGEWIESHTLHIYMLHAPDFLGYEDAISIAKKHPDVVKRGLRLKKTGNEIVALLGGREIHPINVKIGGFYKVPRPKELRQLRDNLLWAKEAAIATIRWVSGFTFPEFSQDYEFVALSHPQEYPFNEGKIVSSKGLEISAEQYEKHFLEEHVPHSHALHSKLKGRGPYMVGPMARYNLNYSKLTPLARELAQEIGLGSFCDNPFQSIQVRSIEVLYAVEEALAIIENYEMPENPAVEITPRAGTGFACTEAPRGILYHRYQVGASGMIQEANIVPPTSQNQKMIEDDLSKLVPQYLELPHNQLTWQCEQAIRNYDPCISCATHFLKLDLQRASKE